MEQASKTETFARGLMYDLDLILHTRPPPLLCFTLLLILIHLNLHKLLFYSLKKKVVLMIIIQRISGTFLTSQTSSSSKHAIFFHRRRSKINSRFVAPAFAGLLLASRSLPLSLLSTLSFVHSYSYSTIPTTTMPQAPYQYRDATETPFDLTTLGSQLNESNKKQQAAFDTSRQLQVAITKANNGFGMQQQQQKPFKDVLEELKKSLIEAVGETSNTDRTPRTANLGSRVEDFVRILAFHHFLSTGMLLSPLETSSFATDEEYLAGACMGLCHDLARYGLGRATARDVASVTSARDLIQAIHGYLLKFDFRNGYLRRKYDSTKYALKSLETILYELSVTGATIEVDNNDNNNDGEPSAKRVKIDLTPEEELEAIRLRMEHRDELREKLIKRCRDGQKAAKQAIYALHRQDAANAAKLLKKCEDCITQDLLPIIKEEPPLRQGSFANVMEEYAEAKLFFAWLHGVDDKTPSKSLSGILLKPEDFTIELEPDEYLGGLCDLTGEIGRYAVQRGTARDFDGVKRCLEANAAVQDAIQTMERFPGSIGKKMDQLRHSVEKIERMMYEMSLSEAAGGRKVDSEEITAENDNFEE